MTEALRKSIALADLDAGDWQEAEELAVVLGVSSKELVRDFLDEFNTLSPVKQVEFMQAVMEANAVVPKMNAALDHIDAGLANCSAVLRELGASLRATASRVSRIETSLGLQPAP